MTRWQGTGQETGLRPMEAPISRAAAFAVAGREGLVGTEKVVRPAKTGEPGVP